jgi:hypothetical protein
MTVHDLVELELAYAPPYGSAKDPVNLAGMAAQNVLAGDVALAQWNEVALLDPRTTLLLDVRRPDERARGFIPGSTHIPLDELRQRLTELPHMRNHRVLRATAQRSAHPEPTRPGAQPDESYRVATTFDELQATTILVRSQQSVWPGRVRSGICSTDIDPDLVSSRFEIMRT